MAERQNSSRRSSEKRSGPKRQADTPHSTLEKQTPSRRNDVIRCENCGEDYSVTYKRCPFCDERPGRSGINGRRASGRTGGGPVHPIQMIGLVVSLILIIAALFIVFKYVGPLLFGDKQPAGGSSSGSSQSNVQSGSGSSSGGDGSSSDGSTSAGDVSQSVAPEVTVESIRLDKVDFTLRANEESQIIASIAPADADVAVTWTSSNPDVLTVDKDGIVKNVNTSSDLIKTTVTAVAGDKQAECTVYCRGSGSAPSSGGSTPATGGSGTTTGPVAANTPGTIVNAGSGLNIRSGPGSEYEKVASASNGAQIVILEDTGTGWYKIDYGGGKVGYVSSSFVSVKK